MNSFVLRYNDVGAEIPLTLTDGNDSALSSADVTSAQLRIRTAAGVLEITLDPPGSSVAYPDQWIATTTEAHFTSLAVGTYSALVFILLASTEERYSPTLQNLTIIIKPVF